MLFMNVSVMTNRGYLKGPVRKRKEADLDSMPLMGPN